MNAGLLAIAVFGSCQNPIPENLSRIFVDISWVSYQQCRNNTNWPTSHFLHRRHLTSKTENKRFVSTKSKFNTHKQAVNLVYNDVDDEGGRGGGQNLKKSVTYFMDGPLNKLCYYVIFEKTLGYKSFFSPRLKYA